MIKGNKIMKRILLSIALITGSLFTQSGFAANTENFKIGVIDIQHVIKTAPQRETMAASLRNEFSSRKNELIELGNEITKQEEKLKKDSEILSVTEKRTLEANILKRKRNLKRASQSLQEDVSLSENEKIQSLISEIEVVVDKIADKEKFDLILTREAAPFHVSQRVDLTEKVISELKLIANKGK